MGNRFALVIFLSALYRAYSQGPACGAGRPEIITQMNGAINTPDFPENYPPLVDCSWHISAPNYSETIVQLSFVEFNTDNADFIYIYDGPYNTNVSLLVHSGNHRPDPVLSTGPDMFIEFDSEAPTPSRTGFYAKYTTDPACTLSSNRVVENPSSGYIESPFYPDRYGLAFDCSWIVRAPTDTRIYFEFPVFEMEDCCLCDYVTMEESGQVVVTYCSVNLPVTYVSTTNEVTINFISDTSDSAQLARFRIYYQFTDCSGGQCTTIIPPPTTTTVGTTVGVTTTTVGTTVGVTTPSTTSSFGTGTYPTGTVDPPITEIFISLLFNATMSTSDGQPLDSTCQTIYKEALRQNVLGRIISINDRIDQARMCTSANQVLLVQSDQSFLSLGSMSLYEADVSLMAYRWHTFDAHHDCAREIISYWTNSTNWQQPIIGQEPGCPIMLFQPDNFELRSVQWKCEYIL